MFSYSFFLFRAQVIVLAYLNKTNYSINSAQCETEKHKSLLPRKERGQRLAANSKSDPPTVAAVRCQSHARRIDYDVDYPIADPIAAVIR